MTTTPQEALKQALDRATSTLHTISQSKDLSGETLAGLAAQALVDVAALSQQAAQEPQPVYFVRLRHRSSKVWAEHGREYAEALERDCAETHEVRRLYAAAPAKPAEQEKAPPLETPHEFALKALVAAGHVTQEKVDKALEIAGKFTAHTRQAPAGEVPFKLVDIVSDGYEGWANLIFTGPGWEGGCVAMLQPAYAEVVRAALSTPPAVPPGWKLVPVEPAPEWISNLERSSGDTCELPTEAIAECIRDLLSAAPAAPQGEQTNYEAISQYLYKLLDDIDTAGDAAKSDDARYRRTVELLQSKKSAVVTECDGYTVKFKNPEAKP